tara:strand:- start:157 stop:1173 length:1017 start_codon:yes stop_codon:yes gene_type:complete
MNKQILLVNLGSPKSLSKADVKEYLKEFLSDDYVVDLPKILQQFILRAFILPFRPSKTKEAYEKIWEEDGSPLIINTQKIATSLSEKTGWKVDIAMRYQEPSIREKVKKYKERKTSEVIVIPLYPHHAMSTTKTTKIEIDKIVSEEYPSLKVKYIEPFYDDPRYIDALSHSIKPYLDDLDKLIFSYHGIPERHLTKGDVVGDHCMKVENCCDINCKSSQNCYRSNVLATSKLTADQLELADNQWMVSFQSRVSIMGPAWLKPYTDIEIDKLGENGMEKIGVVCPSFIADCLETLEEIEMQAKESFIESGGKELVYIPCLNNNPEFINALESIIEDAVV